MFELARRLVLGMRFARRSLTVLWNDKSLMVFPLLSGLAAWTMTGLFTLGIGPDQVEAMLSAGSQGQLDPNVGPLAYIALFLVYFALSFVTVFFNVALIGSVHVSLDGGDSTVSGGIRTALSHVPAILGWSIISGTVGLLLSALENGKTSAQVLRSVLGTVWSIITYLVVPVLVLENKDPVAAIRRSARLVRKVWGEGAGAHFGLAWIMLIGWLPAVLFLMSASPDMLTVPVVALLTLYVITVTVVHHTIKGIVNVVLYRYGADDDVAVGFDRAELTTAFGGR